MAMISTRSYLAGLGIFHLVFGLAYIYYFYHYANDLVDSDGPKTAKLVDAECTTTLKYLTERTMGVIFAHQCGLGMLALTVALGLDAERDFRAMKQVMLGIFFFNVAIFGIAMWDTAHYVTLEQPAPPVWLLIAVSGSISLYSYLRREVKPALLPSMDNSSLLQRRANLSFFLRSCPSDVDP